MKTYQFYKLLAALVFGVLLAGPVAAQDTPPALEDLIGVRASSGERMLEQRGYRWVRTEKTSDSAYSYWQEYENGQCVTVRTHNGRYASIVYSPAFDCQQKNETAGSGSGSYGEPTTTTEHVRFSQGATGTELTGSLTPGSSARYVLRAKKMQDLYVRVAANGSGLYYQIFNPDNSFLLEQMTADKEYRGQLWQSGEHVIEVINRGQAAASYNVIISID